MAAIHTVHDTSRSRLLYDEDKTEHPQSAPLSTTIYLPLIPQQIRVLKLIPGRVHEPLRCLLLRATLVHLHAVRLDEPDHERSLVEYECISYCWGTNLNQLDISCNGHNMSISLNLGDALRHVRRGSFDSEPRYVWADALCINQSSLSEKSEQVQLMFTIFEKASNVICWLGYPEPGEERILEHLEYGTSSKGEATIQDAISFVENHAWFRRTWVRQEIHAARHSEFCCGDYEINPDRLFDMLDSVVAKPARVARILFGYPALPLLWKRLETDAVPFYARKDIWHARREYMKQWLHIALDNAAGFEATLETDRIYALQNLIGDGKRRGIWSASARLFPVIDYTKSTVRLFEDFTRLMLFGKDQDHLNLDVLNVLEPRHHVLGRDLPSWVVDYRIDQPRLVLHRSYGWARSRQTQTIPFSVDPRPGILKMRGAILGYVGSTCADQSLANVHLHCLHEDRGAMLYGSHRRLPRHIHVEEIDFTFWSGWTPETAARAGRIKAMCDKGESVEVEDDWVMNEELVDIVEYHRCEWESFVSILYSSPCSSDIGDRDEDDSEPLLPMFCELLVSKAAKPGDLVVMLGEPLPNREQESSNKRSKTKLTCHVQPYIIRPHEDKYIFLGPCLNIGPSTGRYEYGAPAKQSHICTDYITVLQDIWDTKLSKELQDFELIRVSVDSNHAVYLTTLPPECRSTQRP